MRNGSTTGAPAHVPPPAAGRAARAALDAVLGPTFGRAMVAARRSLPDLRSASDALDARVRDEERRDRAALARPAVQVAAAGTLTGTAAAGVAVVEVDDGPPDSPADGAAAGDPPPSSATLPRPGRRHVCVPRRPSSERTGRLLVLALVCDREGGHPDNLVALARALSCSRFVVRQWRDSLLHERIIEQVGGFLRIGPGFAAWRAAAEHDFASRGLRFGFDPLPRRFLAAGHRPAVVHAAAIVYADAIGFRDPRRFVRADEERAALANVSEPTVRRARTELREMRFVEVEALRRGRANLRRVKLPADAKGTHGSPMAEKRAATLAERAERGRVRRPAGGNCVAREGGNCVAPHHQEPTVPVTIRAEAGPARADGAAAPAAKDGQAGSALAPANAVAALAQVAQAGGDLLAELARQRAEQNPQQQAEQAQDREASTRQRAERLLADGPRLERAVADGRTADLLAAFGVFDRCDRVAQHKAAPLLDRRRQGLAVRLAQVAGSTSRAASIVVQVAAAALRWRKLRSLGALVAKRLERFIADANLVAVAGPWAALDVRTVAAVFRGERPAPRARGERRSDAAPIAKDHAEHPAVRALRSRVIGAAQAGDWGRLLRALGEPIARERGLGTRAASDWSGVPEATIEAGLAAAREAAAARFDAARRATA